MRGRTAQLLKQTGHNSGVQDRSSRAGCPLFGEIRVDVRCVSVAERISLMATNTVAVLAANTYGKSRVRVLHLKRGSQHIPHDFTVQVLLEVSARFFFFFFFLPKPRPREPEPEFSCNSLCHLFWWNSRDSHFMLLFTETHQITFR
jgi:hypothetical protein